MKSNKVLLGLFAGVMALIGGAAHAQVDTNFYEIGPDNIGGSVSCMIADMNDANGSTVYAGAVSGGLFVRSSDSELLENLYARQGKDVSLAANHGIWHYVPYYENGVETVLPVNSLAQFPEGAILVGTGDNDYQVGSTNSPMSTLGRGIFRFNPSTLEYSMVPGTKPTATTDRFAAVRDIELFKTGNTSYVYVVTGTGIYRWVLTGDVFDDSQWGNCETVFEGAVDQMLLVMSLRVAYFSVGNQLYMISDITAANPSCSNVSSSNRAFGGTNTAIKLAVAPTDPSYLYAMVINANGLMENVYLTRDLQTWSTLATSTVTPFTRTALNGQYAKICDGRHTGFIQVDPYNPKRIYIAGSSIWSGEGYVENSYYQWTKVSMCEAELNYGSYMATVFSNYSFVHSAVNQILPIFHHNDEGGVMEFYIATDGGIYMTTDFSRFNNINRGLNNLQINSIAVCPDASIISGAHNNGCPMIESRTAHNGGEANISWYDNGTLGNVNHDANILWTNNGGQVAASMFQQIRPQARRSIFVSTSNAFFGRSFGDYLDYTNTQTWTTGRDFASNRPYRGTEIGRFYLWETYNDEIFNDSINVIIDTLGYVMRPNNDGGYDSTYIGRSNFQIKANDKILVASKANSDYPFEYTFTANQPASQHLRVKNPIQSRAMFIASDTSGENSGRKMWTVYMSWRATDYSKVWDLNEQKLSDWSTLNMWPGIYMISVNDTISEPRALAMSPDGRAAYISVQNLKEGKSMLVRVRGFENVDFSAPTKDIYAALRCRQLSSQTVLYSDTLAATDTSVWFPRVISSITVDTTSGNERLILTFEDYTNSYPNVAIVNNILANNWTVQPSTITNNKSLPAFSSMVDRTTGDIYVGTADGVWIKSGDAWSKYEHLHGVAVTSMVQQQANLPVRRLLSHNGINPENHLYAKTKWTNAMYFGTYGRGIFMDMSKVTDRTNEIVEQRDLGVPTVVNTVAGSVSVFPNPVSGDAHLTLIAAEAGNAQLRIYDLNGRCVMDRQLGTVDAGVQTFTVSTDGMAKGMYLVNVIISGRTAVAKMMVR